MAASTFSDTITLIQALAWPLVVLVIVLAYRRELPALVRGLLSRVSRISFATLSVDVSLSSMEPDAFAGLRAVDDRVAAEVPFDSATGLFFFVQSGSPVDSVVVDLSAPGGWLTSRIYLLCALAPVLRGVRCVVFVETHHRRPRFIGLSSPDAVQRALGARCDWFPKALADAQFDKQKAAGPLLSELTGRLKAKVADGSLSTLDIGFALDQAVPPARRPLESADAFTLNAIGTAFLAHPLMHIGSVDPANTPTPDGWVTLGKTYPYQEHAQWVRSGDDLRGLLGAALTQPGVAQSRSRSLRDVQRDALLQSGAFVARTGRRGSYIGVIDRALLADKLAQAVAADRAG